MAKKSKVEQDSVLEQLNGEMTMSKEVVDSVEVNQIADADLTTSELEVRQYEKSDVEIQLDSNERVLSAAEQFYLESHRNSTDKEIAGVLELDENFVKDKRTELNVTFEKKQPSVKDLVYSQERRQWEDSDGNVYNGPDVNVDDVKETVEVKKQVTAGIKAGDLIGRNEKKSVAVMTGGASQMSDIIKGTKQRLIPSCVHQPKKAR